MAITIRDVARLAGVSGTPAAERSVAQRTALINTLRGHAGEFGIVAGKGIGTIAPLLSAIEQEAAVPPEAKEMFVLLGQQIEEIGTRIKEIDA